MPWPPFPLFWTHLFNVSSFNCCIDGSSCSHLLPPCSRIQGGGPHVWVSAGQLGHAPCQADKVGLVLQA